MNTYLEYSTVKARIKSWFGRDWRALLFYVFAALVMTYPLILNMGGNDMPITNDLYMKLWDVWWLEHLIETGQAFYQSEDLFHPIGLNLSYHPTSWTSTALTWLFSQVVSVFTAYKIMILVAIITSAYSAYLLALWLTKHRMAALLGGAIYGIAPYHIGDLKDHPDLSQLAPIPITVLFFLQSLSSGNLLLAAGAGLMLGLVAWTGLYLFGFTAITLAILFIYLALVDQRWREKRFWITVATFAAASLIILAPRLYPVLKDSETLSYVIEEKFTAFTLQADVLAFVVPPGTNPLFTSLTGQISANFAKSESRHPSPYLGWVAITAVLSALFWRKNRKEIWAWLMIGVVFMLLSAGPVLRFNGQVYEDIQLPASLLLNIELFRSVRPQLFHIGLLLPLAVLASYGFSRWFNNFDSRPLLIIRFASILAFLIWAEYWIGQFPLSPLEVSPIYEQFATDTGDYAIIDIPMGYTESKRYLFLQSLHSRPIAEGMSSRMPPNAFDYIEANPLLARWQNLEELNCQEFSNEDYVFAIDALIADDFRYVVLHRQNARLRSYLDATTKDYDDEILSVYALSDLRDNPPCSAE